MIINYFFPFIPHDKMKNFIWWSYVCKWRF